VNIFYLVTAILNFIPAIAVNKPAATLVPLSFVILLGIAKEAVAEIKRYQDDKKTNAVKAIRMIDGKGTPGIVCKDDARFEETCLSEIKCGDILKIVDGE
jgi:4-hydroxybenzoate polyprenyltransferase